MLIRIAVIAASLACAGGPIWAQTDSANQSKDKSEATDKSEHNTGRTTKPEDKGQKQPQGKTGPLTTGHGGAPPESPQGQSPPNMQAAPEGSSKTVVEPDK